MLTATKSLNLLTLIIWLNVQLLCVGQESADPPENKQVAAPKATDKSKVSKPTPKPGKGSKKNQTSDSNSDQGESADELTSTPGIQLQAPRTMDMQFGMQFFANDNWCTDLYATMPFPLNWPEQRITVTSWLNPGQIEWQFRDLPIGSKQSAHARQLLLRLGQLGPHNELDILVNVEVEKYFIDPPPDTSVFVIPKKISKELNWFMGSSPYIDVELGEVKRIAKQIAAENPPDAWTQVEGLYDWVRNNIKYRNGNVRKIADALKDKQGDCEEMTGIFVALCRASKIPARCVWIPGHCYPEFYLEDPQGVGHWFPCQAAGERQFGQMHDYRPILQKGDRFKLPEQNAPLRYVANFFKCNSRPASPGLAPSIKEVLDLGPLKEELAALQQQTDRGAE